MNFVMRSQTRRGQDILINDSLRRLFLKKINLLKKSATPFIKFKIHVCRLLRIRKNTFKLLHTLTLTMLG